MNDDRCVDLLVRAMWHLELVLKKYDYRLSEYEKKDIKETISVIRELM